jgi:uncharacterized membrane protein
MTRLTRALFWLRHKLIFWLNHQSTEALAVLMFGCCAFVMALSAWMLTITKGW